MDKRFQGTPVKSNDDDEFRPHRINQRTSRNLIQNVTSLTFASFKITALLTLYLDLSFKLLQFFCQHDAHTDHRIPQLL